MKKIYSLTILITIISFLFGLVNMFNIHESLDKSSFKQKLLDERDNNEYETIKIGDQIWFKENLKFKSPNSICYRKRENNCRENGRLYNADELDFICPEGWRVPNLIDWKILKSSFASDSIYALLDSVNWKVKNNHTDESGFALRGAGYQFSKREFIGKEKATSIWLNHFNKFDEYYHVHIYGGEGTYFKKSDYITNEVLHAHPIENLAHRRFSVRCICNDPVKYAQDSNK